MARVPPSPPPAPSLQQQRAVHERCRHPRGAFTPFGPEDLSRSVPARFEGQARRHAGRVALAAHGRSLTYAELNRAANRVARALATRADAADRPTALLFGQGAAAIVAMLGVLKAGRFYVFLDPTLPDGCLTHLGRQDFQVKIRGHRVESAEVELALLELPGIREAVVTAGVGRAGEQELIAYVVPAGEPPTPGALRIQLAARLPDYMLPAAFVALPDLPLTDTGKVDVRALPAPGRGRSLPGPAAAPATPMQEALAAIWREVLDLDEVGVHDDFLALGGNSLLATQILARVQRAFGTSLPPSALLGAGTVTEMAGLLGDAGPLAADSA